VAHDTLGDTVSKNTVEPGITRRGASFRAEAFDAAAGKRIYKTFSTITAARQWRQDAYAALRRGELSADRGQTLREAADEWLVAARAGIVLNRSGDPYKAAAPRGYEHTLNRWVLESLDTSACARSPCRSYSGS
jgi:hypothetical protein